jgi:hypothetical protein
MKHKMIIDMTTDRIIWFSSDMEENAFPDGNSVILYHDGDLPEDMNRNNCWTFRYRNKKITKIENDTNKELPLIELNRTSIRDFVKKTIFNKRQSNFPASIYDFFIHNSIKNEMEKDQAGLWAEVMKDAFSQEFQKLIFSEAFDLEMYLAKTEKLKIFTMKKINEAKTSEELFEIKGKFIEALEKID